MKRDRPLSGLGSQYMHDPRHFSFVRNTGLPRGSLTSEPQGFPWKPLAVLLALILLGLWLTQGTASDEVIGLRMHQVQR